MISIKPPIQEAMNASAGRFLPGSFRSLLATVALACAAVVARAEVTLEILRQPTNTTLLPCATATISVAARALESGVFEVPITYQWQSRPTDAPEWADVPNATNAAIILARPQEPNAIFRCQLSAGGLSVTSDPARLTIVEDLLPPGILSVTIPSPDTIVIHYDMTMDPFTTTDPFNYALTDELVAGVTMTDPATAVLTVQGSLEPEKDYVLAVSNIHDGRECGGVPIADNTTVSFRTPSGAVIEILEQPSNAQIEIHQTALFIVSARATFNGAPAPITYQWQMSGPPTGFSYVDIPEGTNETYAIFATNCASGWFFRCIVRSTFGVASSRDALYLAYVDCEPPAAPSVWAVAKSNVMTVRFDDIIDPVTLTDLFNYALVDLESGRPANLIDVQRVDDRTALLFVDSSTPLRARATYSLILNGIANLSDPECGCKLIALNTTVQFTVPPDNCVYLSQQPGHRTTVVGCAATFSANARWAGGAFAQPFTYQWYKDAAAIAGATNRTYTTPPVSMADHGAAYHVVVGSGDCLAVGSSNATLTVRADATGLYLSSALPGLAPNTLVLEFSTGCDQPNDRLDATVAEDLSNYQLSDGVVVQSATVDCDSATVRLMTSPMRPDAEYTLTIANVRSDRGDVIQPGRSTTVRSSSYQPLAPGYLWTITQQHETLLQWGPGGILEQADQPEGPWSMVENALSPLLVISGPTPCGEMPTHPRRFYRAWWP